MNKVFFGDCRESMREMIAQGIKAQMCVTSPPYFGLRDYGHPGQLGLEATPAEFVANMVEVFRMVRDVLADDGVLWLNLGDSYAGGGGHSPNAPSSATSKSGKYGDALKSGGIKPQGTIKPKDLIGIPWRVAFALQADGWYLRQDIIWHKPNPMPESVTDRCTKAHEYIFLLSKNERYYFDHEAIKETVAAGTAERYEYGFGKAEKKAAIVESGHWHTGKDGRDNLCGEMKFDEKRNKRSVWTVATTPYSGAHFATFPPALIEPCIMAGSKPGDIVLDPFFGSGTTGQVSQALGRQWIGCELNPAYEPLQLKRTAQGGLAL